MRSPDLRGRAWFEWTATVEADAPHKFAVNADRCPAHVAVAPGRLVRCTGPVGHGPAEDMHQGLLRVTLSDGREHAASLVWSTAPSPWDDDILARGMR